MADIKDYLSCKQFAKEAGICKAAVSKAINEGRIRVERIDTMMLIHKEELANYLARK